MMPWAVRQYSKCGWSSSDQEIGISMRSGLRPHPVGLAEPRHVAAAGAIGPVVGGHQRGIVEEAVLDEEIERMVAQVPGWRAVAAGRSAGEATDRLVGPHQIRLLLLAALAGGRDMRPAVMTDLVAGGHDRLADLRIALNGEAGREPGGVDGARLEQIDNPARADQAEFTARQRRRRAHPTRNEARLRIEVEGEADNVARHGSLSLQLAENAPTCIRTNGLEPAREARTDD